LKLGKNEYDPMKIAFRFLPYLYLVLAMLALVSLVLVIMSIVALFQEHVHHTPNQRELAALVALLFIAIGLSSVYLLNAIFLLKRVNRKASIVLSLMSCIGFPLGTILGTISLLVLTRDEIKNEYV
jgi:hypothetical protein